MKQKYVKPMIECEEFVANEYCQSCWLVTCVKGEKEVVYLNHEGNPNYDILDRDGDGFGTSIINGVEGYYGTLNGKEGENSLINLGLIFRYHPIASAEKVGDGKTLEPGKTPGPNAS